MNKTYKNNEQNILFNEHNQCQKYEDLLYVCMCVCIYPYIRAGEYVCLFVYVSVFLEERGREYE